MLLLLFIACGLHGSQSYGRGAEMTKFSRSLAGAMPRQTTSHSTVITGLVLTMGKTWTTFGVSREPQQRLASAGAFAQRMAELTCCTAPIYSGMVDGNSWHEWLWLSWTPQSQPHCHCPGRQPLLQQQLPPQQLVSCAGLLVSSRHQPAAVVVLHAAPAARMHRIWRHCIAKGT